MYNISKIAEVIDGKLYANRDKNFCIKDLAYDSRKVQGTENALFFALVTDKNNGHKYIEELHQWDVHNFVVDNSFTDIDRFPQANFIVVEDTLVALQKLAKYHRKQFAIPVIGITGSNGKTAVKEWLFQLLCPDNKIVYTPNSFNSQIGVPISVWNMSKDDQLGIFEAGISQPNEMNALKEINEPLSEFLPISARHTMSLLWIFGRK